MGCTKTVATEGEDTATETVVAARAALVGDEWAVVVRGDAAGETEPGGEEEDEREGVGLVVHGAALAPR